MQYDVMLIGSTDISDFNDVDTPVFIFKNISRDEFDTLMNLADRNGGITVCVRYHHSEA
jgi:hypothetical protein|nr:MAG TPA: hypothetical protein [Caudoviricetes sp.]